MEPKHVYPTDLILLALAGISVRARMFSSTEFQKTEWPTSHSDFRNFRHK
jgi:hypothetical protein